MKYIIEVNDVSFTYAARTMPSLSHINVKIPQGDFLLITGATGCGKSTLLKMFNGLIPHESGGQMTGDVQVMGASIHASSIAELSQFVGVMFQSPDDQIFSATVFDEVAFILENQGMEYGEIAAEVSQVLKVVGLPGMEQTSIHALSGGQKQRLALAAILVARPQVLVLDEPISQLDPQGAAELLAVVSELNRTWGMTVVIVEHRLHEVMPLCRNVAIMDQGNIVWQGSYEQALSQAQVFIKYGLRLPHAVELCYRLGIEKATASIEKAVAIISQEYRLPKIEIASKRKGVYWRKEQVRPAADNAVIAIHDLSFQYEQKGSKIVNKINLTIPGGQFVALMGKNGAGKSTLLQLISGLLPATTGQVKVNDKEVCALVPEVGLVLQNPDLMLFNLTVEKEILFALRQRKVLREKEKNYVTLIQDLGLNGLEGYFPLALSRGQRFRVAIAAALAVQPAVLLLDEPTTGQDMGHIRDVAQLLKVYVNNGGTVIFCTHDTEVAAEYADRIIIMQQGEILADAAPVDLFFDELILRNSVIKPPQITKIAQLLYNGKALTVEEVAAYVRQNALGNKTKRYAYL